MNGPFVVGKMESCHKGASTAFPGCQVTPGQGAGQGCEGDKGYDMAHTLTEQTRCNRYTALQAKDDTGKAAPVSRTRADSRFQPIEQLMSRFDQINLNFAAS